MRALVTPHELLGTVFVETDDLFNARYAFYRFWDDVKHYVRMGWYEEGRFSGYAQALEAAMDAAGIDPSP